MSASHRVTDVGNGVWGAETFVPVALTAEGDPYPGGGYWRSEGTFYTYANAVRAVERAGGHVEQHAVFATNARGEKFRVSDPLPWGSAQSEWRRLDDLRRARRFPTVRHFEVRSMDDPAYAPLPVSFGYATPVERSRGFKNVRDAARRAWLLWQGSPRNGAEQGNGGWFYWHNGRAACQGLQSLAELALSRGLVEQGTDGRWYPMVSEL